MRFNNLVEVKSPTNLDLERTVGDLLRKLVKRCSHEVIRVACLARQVHGRGDRVHGRKLLH
jgi:hypothetical protein